MLIRDKRSLADADDRGKLNREEFHVAMGLIYRGMFTSLTCDQITQFSKG